MPAGAPARGASGKVGGTGLRLKSLPLAVAGANSRGALDTLSLWPSIR